MKRGVHIAAYRGRRLTTKEADRREARGARYQFELNNRWTIDGSPRWNVARYINHSCRTQGRDRDRGSAPNRARGGNHLRLWAGVPEVLFGEWRLPLPSVSQKESSSSPESAPRPQTDQIIGGLRLRAQRSGAV